MQNARHEERAASWNLSGEGAATSGRRLRLPLVRRPKGGGEGPSYIVGAWAPNCAATPGGGGVAAITMAREEVGAGYLLGRLARILCGNLREEVEVAAGPRAPGRRTGPVAHLWDPISGRVPNSATAPLGGGKCSRFRHHPGRRSGSGVLVGQGPVSEWRQPQGGG